jgi:hypothetical protein
MTDSTWTVYVDDNFHYMDEDERYCLGTFNSLDEAVAACRKIVDQFLQDNSAETAEELYQSYVMFGEDPWIAGQHSGSDVPAFSARKYAQERCKKLRP